MFFSQNIAFPKVAFCLNEMVYLLIGEQGFLGQVITLPFFHAGGSLLFINYKAINTANLSHPINIFKKKQLRSL